MTPAERQIADKIVYVVFLSTLYGDYAESIWLDEDRAYKRKNFLWDKDEHAHVERVRFRNVLRKGWLEL